MRVNLYYYIVFSFSYFDRFAKILFFRCLLYLFSLQGLNSVYVQHAGFSLCSYINAMDMDVERETDGSTTANNAYVVYLLATVVLSRLPFACQYSIESQIIKPI